jgi:hypothetical protein
MTVMFRTYKITSQTFEDPAQGEEVILCARYFQNVVMAVMFHMYKITVQTLEDSAQGEEVIRCVPVILTMLLWQ